MQDVHAKNVRILLILPLLALLIPKSFADPNQDVRLGPDLEVQELVPGIWLHISYLEVEGYGRVGANGLIIIGKNRIFIIDTPWTNDQAKHLDAWILKTFNRKSDMIIPTHFHGDNLGGLDYFHRSGADSIALDKTVALCRKFNLSIPKREFTSLEIIREDSFSLELFYPGEAHSPDNIAVMINNSGVLFGGCLVKAMANKDIGNTAAANTGAWKTTLLNVKKRFPDAKIVVPGHGHPGGMILIDHTIGIVERYLLEH